VYELMLRGREHNTHRREHKKVKNQNEAKRVRQSYRLNSNVKKRMKTFKKSKLIKQLLLFIYFYNFQIINI
jgi:hypothetical protein